MKAKRIEVAPLTEGQIAELAGEYYSEELGAGYSIVGRGGKLVAVHHRHPNTQLIHTETDKFSGDKWWFMNVEFERDETGIISGLRLSGSRVKNLLFRKR